MKIYDARRILDSLVASVLVLDRQLRITHMNSAAEMLFALSFRQAQGMLFHELALEADDMVEGLKRCLETNHPYTERDLPLTLPGERTLTVDCTVAPMLDGEQSEGLVMELHQVDMQLRIRREQALISQRNVSRALLRNLAHEIKNPLGGLRGAAQLLEREFAEDHLKEYTGIIIGEADRLRALVDRMLGPTRKPQYSELNIHEILERVRTLVLAAHGEALSIDRDYDPSIPPLIGDADQLIQALLNIVGNAVEATAGSGHVMLRTRIQRQYTIALRRHRLMARVDVVDDGPGIPNDLGQEIFYPMISGRQEGTGLGLSIAQMLVNQHGGLIEYTSRPGETVFTLLLPLERGDGQTA
ncbi:MAG: nitrogen regulation protein NR(II) [Candidatus Competibacterales bacterium]